MDYVEFLKETVKNCKNMADFCRALDKKPVGGNYYTLYKLIEKYNLDVTHFTKDPWNKGKNYIQKRYSLEEILVENSPFKNSTHLRHKLINAGLLKGECEICKVTNNLQLHHKNFNHYDNRLENLQILCPTHHAEIHNNSDFRGTGQTHSNPNELILSEKELQIRNDARILAKRRKLKIDEAIELIKNSPNQSIEDFSKKSTRSNASLEDKECPICHKIFHPRSIDQKYCSQECAHKVQSKIPNKESFIKSIIELKANFTKIGEKYQVSDNAIRKWCKKYNLPYRKKELLEYINEKRFTTNQKS